MKYKIIRISTSILLLFLGGIIFEGYKEPLYLYWIIVLLIYVLLIEMYLAENIDLKSELSLADAKITSFSINSNLSSNDEFFQCVLLQRDFSGIPKKQTRIQYDLILNSPVTLAEPMDLRLSSKDQIDVYINNRRVETQKFASSNEFIIKKDNVAGNSEKKVFKYTFEIEFKLSSKYQLEISLQNDKYRHTTTREVEIK